MEKREKGTLFIDLETGKDYYKRGGIHRDIALQAGYTVAELTPARNEWDDYFIDGPVKGFYVGTDATVYPCSVKKATAFSKNIFKTEKQAKSALALAQITQLITHPDYNGDWVPNWNNPRELKYVLRRVGDFIEKDLYVTSFWQLAFKTEDARNLFLDNNYDLLKEYFEID